MTSLKLDGKIALVTGASRGLGLEIARALVKQGATVVMTARGQSGLKDAAHGLGPNAIPLSANVGDPTQVAALFAEIKARFGKLNILINNAALGIPERIELVSEVNLQSQVQANLLGPIHCIRAAVPLMRVAGGGDVVSISSDSVLLPFPLLSIYAATKAGIEVLSRALRSELAGDNIRVSVLRSGHIADTSFGMRWTAEQQKTAYEVWGKTGHLAMVSQQGVGIKPALIADAILNMVTLGASGNIELLELRAR